MRSADKVAKLVQVLTIGGVKAEPRQGGSNRLMVTISLEPNWNAFGDRHQIVKEAGSMRLMPVWASSLGRPKVR